MQPAFFAKLDGIQICMLGIASIWIVSSTIQAIFGSMHRERRKLGEAKHRADFVRDLLAKGTPAEEIERLAGLVGDKRWMKKGKGSFEVVGASEVVVEREGEWVDGVILQASDESCRVHLVGHPRASDGWIPVERIGFSVAAFGRPALDANPATALEVIARNEGEYWAPALVLRIENQSYYVHFVDDGPENTWLDESQIRFRHRTMAGFSKGQPVGSMAKAPSADPDF